jgi:iron complex outermembrane receptor protein
LSWAIGGNRQTYTIENTVNASLGETFLADPLRKQLLEGGLTFNGRYRILGYYGSQFSQLGTTFATSLKIDL